MQIIVRVKPDQQIKPEEQHGDIHLMHETEKSHIPADFYG